MRVKFLIAEEIRPETGSKLTILGLFAGDIIIMIKRNPPEGSPEGSPAGLERLAILATISDAPDGMHKFKGRIVNPSQELYQPEALLGEAATKKGYSHSVIVEIKPFIVKTMGIYRLEFFVDEEMFTFPFEIREQPQPIGKS